MTVSPRARGGQRLQCDGLQQLGYPPLLVFALLFLVSVMVVIDDVHCSVTDPPTPSPQATTPVQAPTPNITIISNQSEVDALNAILKNWTRLNPQLSTLLNWSPDQLPCDNITAAAAAIAASEEFEGAWRGVGCTAAVRNATGKIQYEVFVTSLQLYGSNSSCGHPYPFHLCGFNGIIGELPFEITKLTSLYRLIITQNPKLTGPVPVEIFQLPSLQDLDLSSNALVGTLPSNISNDGCQLTTILLNNNNFRGSLPLNSYSTFFCQYLEYL